MMEKILITAPHSSQFVPPELLSRFALDLNQIWDATDPGSGETALLAAGNNPELVLPASVSRLVVDLNRNTDDLSPIGVCRTNDFKRNPIYKTGQELTTDEKIKYIGIYHEPWHKEFLKRLTRGQLNLHVDLHNTNELNREKNAYFPGKKVRMLDYTDIDISNRSEFQRPGSPIDQNGLTFPANEIEGVIDSIKKHMGDFFENLLKTDRGKLRVTASGYWRGGPNIQKARDNANWRQGTARSLQIELNRRFFIKNRGQNDEEKIAGLSEVFRKVIKDILLNTA